MLYRKESGRRFCRPGTFENHFQLSAYQTAVSISKDAPQPPTPSHGRPVPSDDDGPPLLPRPAAVDRVGGADADDDRRDLHRLRCH